MNFNRKCESPPESYDISDLKYDDEGTNTPKIRKKIPDWATGWGVITLLIMFCLHTSPFYGQDRDWLNL